MEIKIVKYELSFKQKLLNLLAFMWKDMDDSLRRAKFEWRYENNPYTTSPIIFLAIDDEKVVGFRAFVLQKYIVKNESFSTYSPADAIVHPDYRRRGLFSRLNEAFIKFLTESKIRNGIVLNLSSNQYSTPGYIKQDWQKTNGSKKYGYRFSIVNALRAKLGMINHPDALNSAVSINKDNSRLLITTKPEAEILATFVKSKCKTDKMTNLRDASYFSWRYAFQSEKYFFIYSYSSDELQGYLILKQLSATQFVLAEYLAAAPKILNNLLKHAMKALNIIVLRTWVLSSDDHVHLSKLGFFVEPEKLMKRLGKERLPVLVRPSAFVINEKDFYIEGLDIRDINNWQIFFADSH
jgi:GNAT superfamily N-acetyltransferase